MNNRNDQAIASFKNKFNLVPGVGLTVPGRVELCGNHTDHQRGCVVAAAIHMDMLAVAQKTFEPNIHILSDHFGEFYIDLHHLDPNPEEFNTTVGLIRGIARWMSDAGYPVSGFCCYITSDIPSGVGLSSSAAFGVLIAGLFNFFYAQGKISLYNLALAAQYAENFYFGKPCGLMDQLICSTGGICAIDFADTTQRKVNKIACDCAECSHSLCIVNTDGNHIHLTQEYASITQEIKSIAVSLGQQYLRECDSKQFYATLSSLRSSSGDRAILRAMHFFQENQRAILLSEAMKKKDFCAFLRIIRESGDSSYKYLQNVLRPNSSMDQSIALALAYSEYLLAGEGAVRVHGGGFAGTILAIIPEHMVKKYSSGMDALFGKGSTLLLQVRSNGIQREF